MYSECRAESVKPFVFSVHHNRPTDACSPDNDSEFWKHLCKWCKARPDKCWKIGFPIILTWFPWPLSISICLEIYREIHSQFCSKPRSAEFIWRSAPTVAQFKYPITKFQICFYFNQITKYKLFVHKTDEENKRNVNYCHLFIIYDMPFKTKQI